MTDQTAAPQPEQTAPEAKEQPQHSEIEQRALEMGWRPKEEFDGSEDDFIDAKEFVRRKPLFDKIETQSREIKKVHKALEEFKHHYSKVEESAYRKAVSDLKAKQKEALKDGDVDEFYKIQEELDTANEAVVALKQQQNDVPAVAEEAPQFVEWKSKNPWYNSMPHMKVYADDYGTKLARQGMAPEQVLKAVEKAVREEFPNKFRNPNKDKPGAVEASSGKSGARKGAEYELDDRERKIMNTLVSSGAVTKDQYIADLKKVKGEK